SPWSATSWCSGAPWDASSGRSGRSRTRSPRAGPGRRPAGARSGPGGAGRRGWPQGRIARDQVPLAMFNIGPLELMVILIVALLVVGPRRLPELGRSIGRGLREFRRAQEEVQRTLQLTLGETEPEESEPAQSVPGGAPGSVSDEPGDAGAREPAAKDAEDDAALGPRAVAATLGQGIAELRRVRGRTDARAAAGRPERGGCRCGDGRPDRGGAGRGDGRRDRVGAGRRIP